MAISCRIILEACYHHLVRSKEPDPLIPLDELKKIVRGLAAVPKDAIGKPKPEQRSSASKAKPKK